MRICILFPWRSGPPGWRTRRCARQQRFRRGPVGRACRFARDHGRGGCRRNGGQRQDAQPQQARDRCRGLEPVAEMDSHAHPPSGHQRVGPSTSSSSAERPREIGTCLAQALLRSRSRRTVGLALASSRRRLCCHERCEHVPVGRFDARTNGRSAAIAQRRRIRSTNSLHDDACTADVIETR